MKRLPIGIENFKELMDKDCYYVDKSSLIRDICDKKVVLYTRPRRFGKTLNMSMLYYFFSIKQKENAYLFDGLDISKDTDAMKYQNKYPVIFITLKDMKRSTYELQIEKFASIISNIILKNLDLIDSSALDISQKELLIHYKNRTSSLSDLMDSLSIICDCLELHYQKKAILLIDEYDVPLQSAYLNGYYDEMVDFLRNIFSETVCRLSV